MMCRPAGFIGYLPTPKDCQHNYYLPGGGSWPNNSLVNTGGTWRDVTISRPKHAVQTNNFAYPISVNIYIGNSSSGSYVSLWADTIKVAYNAGSNTSTFYAVVPLGRTYYVQGGVILAWM